MHDPHEEDPLIQQMMAMQDDLEAAGRKIGLYLENMGVAFPPSVPDSPEDRPKPLLVGTFIIGDLAFSDRVQNPEQEPTETEFRKLATQMERDDFEALRDRLAQGEIFQNLLDDDEDGTGVG